MPWPAGESSTPEQYGRALIDQYFVTGVGHSGAPLTLALVSLDKYADFQMSFEQLAYALKHAAQLPNGDIVNDWSVARSDTASWQARLPVCSHCSATRTPFPLPLLGHLDYSAALAYRRVGRCQSIPRQLAEASR